MLTCSDAVEPVFFEPSLRLHEIKNNRRKKGKKNLNMIRLIVKLISESAFTFYRKNIRFSNEFRYQK
jgi:hypothetical protein